MMWHYGWSAWDWLWMAGMMVVFWSAVIVMVVWAASIFAGRRQTGDADLDVLRRRLAAGEITAEDYEKTKRALGA